MGLKLQIEKGDGGNKNCKYCDLVGCKIGS